MRLTPGNGSLSVWCTLGGAVCKPEAAPSYGLVMELASCSRPLLQSQEALALHAMAPAASMWPAAPKRRHLWLHAGHVDGSLHVAPWLRRLTNGRLRRHRAC